MTARYGLCPCGRAIDRAGPKQCKPCRRPRKACSIAGCENPATCRELCERHYMRLRRGLPFEDAWTPCPVCGEPFRYVRNHVWQAHGKGSYNLIPAPPERFSERDGSR